MLNNATYQNLTCIISMLTQGLIPKAILFVLLPLRGGSASKSFRAGAGSTGTVPFGT